ncbi:MAG TPA: pyridoxal-dependent decarboxylase, partial [Thermomicrobiaceae bacterium]|nr:pyridoxal-dependent decarboxylase [Thermomicrobiaceae bacterium]
MDRLLDSTLRRALRYLDALAERPVAPAPAALDRLVGLGGPLPEQPVDPADVLALLDELGSPATVASAGPRYFGFVTGGSLPAALAANWLAGAWDQNVGLSVMSPAAVTLEAIALDWLLDVLQLPPGAAGAFVTGATMANFTCLAAARHAALQRAGWNVEARGLFGAPPITVVAGAEAHVSLLKALALLGLGRERVVAVTTDDQGRLRADSLPEISAPAIVCLQAGNVNTGAFDPAAEVCPWAHELGAWVHIDGAFGLWAAAAPALAGLVAGVSQADSWATDAHKWLNVPYDSGLAFVRDPAALRAAMAASAAYLPEGEFREPMWYTPESSRRARGAE